MFRGGLLLLLLLLCAGDGGGCGAGGGGADGFRFCFVSVLYLKSEQVKYRVFYVSNTSVTF